jgi:hypothetical protein
MAPLGIFSGLMMETLSGSTHHVCQTLASGEIILGFGSLTPWMAISDDHRSSDPYLPVACERSMTCHVIGRSAHLNTAPLLPKSTTSIACPVTILY